MIKISIKIWKNKFFLQRTEAAGEDLKKQIKMRHSRKAVPLFICFIPVPVCVGFQYFLAKAASMVRPIQPKAKSISEVMGRAEMVCE